MKLRRKHLLPVHRWTGLTIGLIVMLSAVTGAGLAFRNHLDPLIYPQLAHGSECNAPIALDRVVAAAQAAHPIGKVDYIRIRTSAEAPIAVRFFNKDTLYFDRCSGVLKASQNRYEGVFGVLEWLHRGIWLGKVGGWLMGAGAIAVLTLLAGFGVYLWWPRGPRRFSQAIRLDRRLKGPAFTLGLHRTVGAWIALPLALSATTGLPNAFEDLQRALMAIGATHQAKLKLPAGKQAVAPGVIDAAWAAILRITNNPGEVLIHVAPEAGKPMEAFAIEADAPHANARSYIYLDPRNGAILRYVPYYQSGIGSRIYYWMLSLHMGELGLLNQVVIFLGAIGAATLGYTGMSTYFGRLARKRKAASMPRASNVEMIAAE